jgi:hypothetical protein
MELIKIKGGKVPAIKCNPATLENCNEQERKYVDENKDTSPRT